jgi:hypothetical protein
VLCTSISKSRAGSGASAVSCASCRHPSQAKTAPNRAAPQGRPSGPTGSAKACDTLQETLVWRRLRGPGHTPHWGWALRPSPIGRQFATSPIGLRIPPSVIGWRIPPSVIGLRFSPSVIGLRFSPPAIWLRFSPSTEDWLSPPLGAEAPRGSGSSTFRLDDRCHG